MYFIFDSRVEEPGLMNTRLNRRELFLKSTAIALATLIVVSSGRIGEVIVGEHPGSEAGPSSVNQSFQSRPCKVSAVLAQSGLWISFDSSAPGTPVETHVTISDTSGITIVADFHGFWRSNCTLNTTAYYELDMPGASSMREPGAPMLPSLFEYIEIPYNVDVSIEVLASSMGTTSGYNIIPAPPPNIPVGVGEPDYNESIVTALPSFLGPVYSNDTFFPGITTNTEGELNTTSLVMRGHRLLGLSFYPVQYNPATSDLHVYSQLVIKVKYSIPAQIQPIAEHIRSEAFENILMNTLLNYDSSSTFYALDSGITAMSPWTPAGFQEGAEYLIITTQPFKSQADRLAEWKEKKGVPSKVWLVDSGSRQQLKTVIADAYNYWYPAPTYVLLLGDVESIPANYDADHEGMIQDGFIKKRLFDKQDHGIIASDLGYFTIDGNSYIPDMIYGRISVDTEEQAQTIVDKILQYEQYPPADDLFYESIMSAGHFEDNAPLNGVEDEGFPSIYVLEKIRHYLNDNHGYAVHINYSCPWLHYDSDGYSYPYASIPAESLKFRYPLDPSDPDSSKLLINSLPADYEWLSGYTAEPHYTNMRGNITSNINEGRFLVLYYSHGGSKNMVYPIDVEYPPDYQLDNGDRDFAEGWHLPWLNTSYFSDLSNGNELPLIVSIACNTGWFDGETDQVYMTLTTMEEEENPFMNVDNECFAENITRLKDGGAIAAISASRPAYAGISGYLLSGLIQAFWPGYVDAANQPIYEMGAALLFGKLYAKSQWKRMRESTLIMGPFIYPEHEERTTFEEYHLFGDPETQLWTAAPSDFDVSHPISIGTSDAQQFVVTVRNRANGEPVHFAKVCIQQKPSIYQVGYTDTRGQVAFEVAPSSTPSHINVTVTKHNFRPNQSIILVKASSAAVSVSPHSGLYQDPINFTVSGFNTDNPVYIYMDEAWVATVDPESQTAQGEVRPGAVGYVNIWAAQAIPPTRDLWEPVANTLFYRLSSILNPDPYIYSQDDRSTWYLADGEIVWDNPCIALYLGSNPISEVKQHTAYDVRVTVYNRGNVRADGTNVSLSYSPLGGGVTWTPLDTVEVSVNPSGSSEAAFSWTPLLANTVSLRVEVDHGDEKPEDKTNNIGYECVNVVPLCSPGNRTLQVGNPTNNTDYVLIKVKQKGNYDEIWNATILGYSSQAIPACENETVILLIDPDRDIELDEGRIFTVEIYINGELKGGMAFDATINTGECEDNGGCCCLYLLIIGLIIIVGIIAIIYYKRRK